MRIDTDKQMNLLNDKNVAISGGGPVGLTMEMCIRDRGSTSMRVTMSMDSILTEKKFSQYQKDNDLFMRDLASPVSYTHLDVYKRQLQALPG